MLPRFRKEDLHRVMERLSECDFLKAFEKTGKARYLKSAEDGIQHGVEFSIERRHGFALVVTPVLLIEHKQAREMEDAGIGVRSERNDFGLIGAALWEIAGNTLHDRDCGGEYGLVPTALENMLDDRIYAAFQNGFWRSMNDLEDLGHQINSDLESAGRDFFRDRDTVPKLIAWLKSDPSAGGTASRIILLCFYYLQNRHEEILATVNSWTEKTASPMELDFADYIANRIRQ